MKTSTWQAENLLLLLMSGGFFVHLISASRHLADSSSRVGDIMLWPVDFALFTIMLTCAAGLILRWRQFFQKYDVDSAWRKVAYWLIAAYVTVSLPGHISFLVTGDTAFFDSFPWWFSVAVMPLYILVVAYIVTLRRRVPTLERGALEPEPALAR